MFFSTERFACNCSKSAVAAALPPHGDYRRTRPKLQGCHALHYPSLKRRKQLSLWCALVCWSIQKRKRKNKVWCVDLGDDIVQYRGGVHGSDTRLALRKLLVPFSSSYSVGTKVSLSFGAQQLSVIIIIQAYIMYVTILCVGTKHSYTYFKAFWQQLTDGQGDAVALWWNCTYNIRNIVCFLKELLQSETNSTHITQSTGKYL
jgi:hypothetical protein